MIKEKYAFMTPKGTQVILVNADILMKEEQRKQKLREKIAPDINI